MTDPTQPSPQNPAGARSAGHLVILALAAAALAACGSSGSSSPQGAQGPQFVIASPKDGAIVSGPVFFAVQPLRSAESRTDCTFTARSKAEVKAATGIDYDALGVTFLGAQEIDSTLPIAAQLGVTSGGFGPMVQPGQAVLNYMILPPTGRNPRGIVLDRAGARAYVMNYLSRDVSVLDLTDVDRRPVLATVAVAPETLAPELLRGKILFHKANDPRISHLGWLSCASCHLEGGVGGTTWPGPDGPRQTQPLWKLAGTAPFHASATRDEVQDAEVDIQALLDGVGLSPGAAMPELGEQNGGRSADLDALARFALEGVRVPRAAPISADQEARGRELFHSASCVRCHSGPHWTVSALPAAPAALSASGREVASALRDVGTATPADVLGTSGFDVPTLLGLGASGPYLHDGSARSLAEVLANPRHAPPLAAQDVADLAAFLGSVDGETVPMEP